MLRVLWTVPLMGLWTTLVLGPCILAGLLTFGRFNHTLPNVFAGPWGRGMLFIAGVRLRVIGAEHLHRGESQMLVMNHQSFLDTVSLAAVNPPGFMGIAKREFAWIPVFGQALWAVGTVFINRRDPTSARAALAGVATLLAAHPRTIVMFPEGTRSRTGQLQPFKMGAFHLALQTRVPIVPTVIYNAWNLQQPGSARITPGTLTLVFHPPRPTTGWTEDGLHAEADALHAEYEAWIAAGPPS